MFSRGQQPPRAEVRIDPEDGQPRTLEELKQLCAGRYSDAEIEEYWNEKCVPHEGEAIHNIANDPFLTHAARAPRTPQPTSQAESQNRDTAPPATMSPSGAPDAANMASTREDPFLTQASRSQAGAGSASLPGAFSDSQLRARRQQQLSTSATAALRHWTESLFRFLGPGDPERDPQKVNIYIFGPWLVFVWVLLLWLLLRHYTMPITVIITIGLCLAFSGMIFVWTQGVRGGQVPFLALGLLCLFATLAGVGVGLMGWNQFWRQYWWTQTGYSAGMSSASTPAGARSDFSVVDFSNGNGGTVNNTVVDHVKSAGYKDEHYYCVAPILSPDTAGVSLVLVNYWAIGMDCCQQLGSFTCDASREDQGAYGMVMLEGGLPCPGCNADKFRLAVQKAEAMHGLVSANDALFVRWVERPSSITLGLLARALVFVGVVAVLSLGVFAALGWLSWYYGVGKLPPGLAVFTEPVSYQKQVD